MAVDKLVDSTQLNADLTSVANAIRTRGGTSAQLAFPNGFITAIEDIPDTGSSLVIVYEDNGNGSFTFLTPYSDIKSAVRNEDAVCFVRDNTLAVGGVVDYRTNYTTQLVTFTECVRLYMQDEELDIYLVTYGYSGGTLQQVSELKYLIPSGTKSITENGTGIDVKRYASVDVNVSGGGGAISLLETITVPSDTRAVNIDLTDYQNYNLFFIIADMELTSSDWVYYVKNGSSASGGTYDGQALRHNFIIAEQANPAGEVNRILSGTVATVQFALSNEAMTNLYIYTYNASNMIKAGSTFKIYGGNYADM